MLVFFLFFFFNKGNITFGDLVSTVPFRNDVGKITTNGSGLWQAFEYSVRRYSTVTPYGEFLQVSGNDINICNNKKISYQACFVSKTY